MTPCIPDGTSNKGSSDEAYQDTKKFGSVHGKKVCMGNQEHRAKASDIHQDFGDA